ncbi:MAG TPA: ribosome maturation factor [Treponema sp.]|nr:ribosome maturation factor [Treponema sp.]
MEPEQGSIFYRGSISVEYTRLDDIPYFSECAAAVSNEGFVLLELQVVPQHGMVHVSVVIASADASKDISVADCSKVHHALQPKLLSLLNKTEDDLSMEVSSPGLERKLKNASEFALLKGRRVRVWNKELGDWQSGLIVDSDTSQVTLEPEEGERFTLTFENIAKAKLLNI